MADRATIVLRVILAGTIAISIVHYADNTIRYDVYTGDEWSFVARWMIPVGWALFTAAGIAGYLAFRQGRFSRSAWLLSVCSVGGLVDPFHFATVSSSDFDGYQLAFIWLDFAIGGLSLLAFAIWTALVKAPTEMARSP